MDIDWNRMISFLDGLLNRPLFTLSGTEPSVWRSA